jgi:hypothetical protein
MTGPGLPRPSWRAVRCVPGAWPGRVLVLAGGRVVVLQLSRPEMVSGADADAGVPAIELSRRRAPGCLRWASGCGASAGAHVGCDAGHGGRARFLYLPRAAAPMFEVARR